MTCLVWAARVAGGLCMIALGVIFFTPLLDRFNVDVFEERD